MRGVQVIKLWCMSCQEISLQRRQTQTLTTHHLMNLKALAQRLMMWSKEHRHRPFGHSISLCPCPDQLSPKMSLGSVYILRSVASLTAERTTHGGRSRPRACHFSNMF